MIMKDNFLTETLCIDTNMPMFQEDLSFIVSVENRLEQNELFSAHRDTVYYTHFNSLDYSGSVPSEV